MKSAQKFVLQLLRMAAQKSSILFKRTAPKQKDTQHAWKDLTAENGRLAQREDRSGSENGESLASTLRQPAPPPKQEEPS